jgi:hypothetical protein
MRATLPLAFIASLIALTQGDVATAHLSPGVAEGPPTAHAARPAGVRLQRSYGDVPMIFESNTGQTDGQVKFLSRGNGYTLFLTPTEAVLAIRPESASAVIRMSLVGANPPRTIAGLEPLPARVHDLRGSDSRRWRRDIRTFARVRYENVYPGIDLLYYGNHGQLEYDFIVAPGMDANTIRWRFDGVDDLRIDGNGELVLSIGGGEVRQRTPVIYQQDGVARRDIPGRYVLTSSREVGFDIDAYDATQPLIIDPVLVYSSYLGGTGPEFNFGAVAVDGSGNAYVTGGTVSTDFPTTAGAFQSTNDLTSAFVSKFDPAGALVYSTYLGGSAHDAAAGIAVDAAGSAYIVGDTNSADFPVTPGAFETACAGCGFVVKLTPSGSALVYSTFLRGSNPRDVAVDHYGHAYVGGNARAGFPITPGAFQTQLSGGPAGDGFVAKLDTIGSSLVYASYLGGSSGEQLYALAIDRFGNVYVTGVTESSDFPTTGGAFQRSCFFDPRFGVCFLAFVTKINATGSEMLYSTYFGDGFAIHGTGIAVDYWGHAYLTGFIGVSLTPGRIRTTPGAFQETFGGSTESFVTKFSRTGSSLVYSTYLGGSAEDGAQGIAVDAAGAAYVSGWTWSADFPVADPIQPTRLGEEDAFITKLNPQGSALVYSTYLGGSLLDAPTGIALDPQSGVYIVGWTTSNDFPTANPIQAEYAGEQDVFVARIAEPPFCPADVTPSLDVFTSAFVPFLIPQLQLQLLLVHNKTAVPIDGPLTVVFDDLVNGLPLYPPSRLTTCTTPTGAPFIVVHPGVDEVLGPNEVTGTFLLFVKIGPGAIAYEPRVLSGVPTR